MIRVAGNVVASSQIGSVEFAASRFDTRLVVVLGHSGCGAIQATLESLDTSRPPEPENLRSIVDLVRPGIEPLLTEGKVSDVERLMEEAVRANVRSSVDHLRRGSPLIENLLRKEGLMVVGAEYDLETGRVEFFSRDT